MSVADLYRFAPLVSIQDRGLSYEYAIMEIGACGSSGCMAGRFGIRVQKA